MIRVMRHNGINVPTWPDKIWRTVRVSILCTSVRGAEGSRRRARQKRDAIYRLGRHRLGHEAMTTPMTPRTEIAVENADRSHRSHSTIVTARLHARASSHPSARGVITRTLIRFRGKVSE